MLATVLHAARNLVLEDRPAPEPGAGEVLLRIRAGGICGSDLSYFFKGKSGDFALQQPLVLGHEAAGEVVALGDGVTTLTPGQRVAINPALPCKACRFCLLGMPNHCLHLRFAGSASVFPHMQGMFQEFVTVAATQCVPIPDHVSFAQASMAEPLAVVLHAIRHAPSLLGARVLVVGCGPIGCLLVAAASRSGAHQLVALDLTARSLELARQLGATETVLATDHDTIAHWSQQRGTFDLVIEASGSPAGLDTALRAARAGGTVLQVGNLPAGQNPVAVNLIMSKELRLVGSFRFAAEYPLAVEEIASGRFDLAPLMSHAFPFAEASHAFEVAQDRTQSMKVHLHFE